MWPHTRSFVIGALGSVVALALSVWALGWSSAITRPRDVGMAVWEWAVVLGLGALLASWWVRRTASRDAPGRAA